MCHARKERVLLIGTDQRITSGPAARTAALKGRIHGCTRTLRTTARFPSCTAGAVHTWLHPNASHNRQIPLLHRGRRPYMAHRVSTLLIAPRGKADIAKSRSRARGLDAVR